MKIKNLTIAKINEICRKHKCKECPLINHTWLCLGTKNMTKKELETDIKLKYDRKYVAIIKYRWLVYNECAKFCFDSFKSVDRYWKKEQCFIDNIIIKYRKSKRIIYQGNDYGEYLKIKGEKEGEIH